MNHLNGNYDILGRSERVREIKKRAEDAAKYDFSILITGETGTGKELLARMVHEKSPRGARPFIYLNCGGIPDELVESELFGHVRGSFTSAMTSRDGKFEAANGGTLFLDEVGNMSYHAQAAMLAASEYGTFSPVGSNTEKKVDVRLVTASNVELCGNKKFRQDLYYRLSQVRLDVPALRERREDIEHIADFYVDVINKKTGQEKRLEPKAANVLSDYDFPGNIRELINIISHAYCMSKNDTILSRFAEERISQERATRQHGDGKDAPQTYAPINTSSELLPTWHETARKAQEELLAAALRKSGGNMQKATRKIGTYPSNVYKFLKSRGYTLSTFCEQHGIEN